MNRPGPGRLSARGFFGLVVGSDDHHRVRLLSFVFSAVFGGLTGLGALRLTVVLIEPPYWTPDLPGVRPVRR
jgi:hypothetical protein